MNEKSVRVLSIVNGGKYGFEYSWDMNERCCILGGLDGNLITVTPKEGTVDAHQRASCVIDFNPTSTVSLKGCQLELKVCMYACVCACVCMCFVCAYMHVCVQTCF